MAITTKLLLLLASAWRAQQALPTWGRGKRGRCHEQMRNSTRASLSWSTPDMLMQTPKYCCRSTAPFGQKRSKCSAVSSSLPQAKLLYQQSTPSATHTQRLWWLLFITHPPTYSTLSHIRGFLKTAIKKKLTDRISFSLPVPDQQF